MLHFAKADCQIALVIATGQQIFVWYLLPTETQSIVIAMATNSFQFNAYIKALTNDHY